MVITNTNPSSIYYYKENVSNHEYKMHQHVYELGIVNIPKVIDYNKTTKVMKMLRVGPMSVSDFYGELITHVPPYLLFAIREIITKLYDNGIIYPDITGYNFIEHDGKVWIIDFEHAKYMNDYQKFTIKFVNGVKQWNPEFR